MTIGVIALAGALVLCAAGGIGTWLLTRDPDRNGAQTPALAVQAFLQAVYHDQDPAQAAGTVCSEARDEASLETKINEIRAYQETEASPSFSWSEPTVVEEGEEVAVVAVTVTMITGDEKTANQSLQIQVLDKDSNGWWVCDLQTVETTGTPPPAGESSSPGETPAPASESPGG